ncbi:MAG TPA: 2-amino-4-hydroxy-6-hydroxymethyldihydropteridine diphosphokinase [Gemmatimonadaceae bacterium]|nr:2-amino-4-hydroxy-6-hydroxymethyldihydropteridine diphosphokinase [Gemmatimonadaceae bacterium]
MIDVAYIALGSNLGDRHAHLARARAALGALPHSRVLAESAIEETAPIGLLEQPPFLNQMIALQTTLSPRELLVMLQDIELREGRVRNVRWGPRTIDLDIVCFDQQTMQAPGLEVPHPELANRDFWRRELAELRGGAGPA